MTECDRIRADAPGLAALRPDDPERIAAMLHASGCGGCARALREAGRLQSLIAAYEPPPLPAGALQRASREIRGQLRRDARRRLIGSVAAVCASVLVFVGFARSRSRSLLDWALAAVLWAFAVVLASTASRKPLLATALAVLAGVAAATISGAPGPLAALARTRVPRDGGRVGRDRGRSGVARASRRHDLASAVRDGRRGGGRGARGRRRAPGHLRRSYGFPAPAGVPRRRNRDRRGGRERSLAQAAARDRVNGASAGLYSTSTSSVVMPMAAFRLR